MKRFLFVFSFSYKHKLNSLTKNTLHWNWSLNKIFQVLTSACAVISIVACDPENLGVITDYEVVHHLAQLTHKVRTSAASVTLHCGNSASVRCLSISPTSEITDNSSERFFILYLFSSWVLMHSSQLRNLVMYGRVFLSRRHVQTFSFMKSSLIRTPGYTANCHF